MKKIQATHKNLAHLSSEDVDLAEIIDSQQQQPMLF